jgi:hypothetical protein
MAYRRWLVALGVLVAMAGTIVGCGGQSNTTGTGGGTTGVQSEEASENDSIESTAEENVETQTGSEETSENDSIQTTGEEQVETSTP